MLKLLRGLPADMRTIELPYEFSVLCPVSYYLYVPSPLSVWERVKTPSDFASWRTAERKVRMSRGKEGSGRVHEKHQLILADLLREEDNRFCTDCLSKGTTIGGSETID